MAELKRVALVTGGGVGMGAATARRLARDGMAVAVLDIDGDTAESVARAIVDAGGRALAVVADVSNRAQVEAAVDKARAQFGPITVLVNNAGIENFSPFEEIEDAIWDRLMEVNLKGVYLVTQVVLPDMLKVGWGRIINISSFGAQVGAPTMVHYAATKGGIIAMTRSLALELGSRGITVNSIAPGYHRYTNGSPSYRRRQISCATRADAEVISDSASGASRRGRSGVRIFCLGGGGIHYCPAVGC